MMPTNLSELLTAQEFASLSEVNKGMLQGIIPFEHRTRLMELGYVAEKIGSLVLTSDGQTRLAKGL
jgi:hypothetical protein